MSSSGSRKIPSGVTEMQYRKALAAVKKQEAASSSIDAAALQADMARRFNLSMGPKVTNRNQLVVRSSGPSNRGDRRSPAVIDIYCDCCQSRCTSADEVCKSCGYFLVGAPEPPPETLAQRRGLVAPPPSSKEPALSETEWNAIELNIIKRSDVESVCPICMEGFKHCDEVLLSCSHIFHRNCLTSFEKFMKNGQLTCPICRTPNYQKKVTQLGSKAYQGVCAVKVQRVFRGHLGRSKCRHLYKQFYKKGKGNEVLRKRYYESQLTHISGKIDQHIQRRSGQVDTMLSSMDRTLSDGKQLDVLFEQMLATRSCQAVQSSLHGRGNISSSSSSRGVGGGEGKWSESKDDEFKYCLGGDSDVCWTDVFETARQRGPSDCAICMSSIVFSNTNAMANGKRNTILSCSHMFHENCILNFERFLVNTVPTCPVCRCAYEKKTYIPN